VINEISKNQDKTDEFIKFIVAKTKFKCDIQNIPNEVKYRTFKEEILNSEDEMITQWIKRFS